ncbi:MAG: GtrA family protein, partial [Armatimonadota bacterium]|nr:GtrA family protein [Armatimonadota bacterium]
NNFTWHKLWTFRPETSDGAATPATPRPDPRGRLGLQFGVFLAVSLVGLALSGLILHTVSQQPLVKAVAGRSADLVAKTIAVAVVWAWNFGANKLWTFRRG